MEEKNVDGFAVKQEKELQKLLVGFARFLDKVQWPLTNEGLAGFAAKYLRENPPALPASTAHEEIYTPLPVPLWNFSKSNSNDDHDLKEYAKAALAGLLAGECDGIGIETAAGLAGVSRENYYKWREHYPKVMAVRAHDYAEAMLAESKTRLSQTHIPSEGKKEER